MLKKKKSPVKISHAKISRPAVKKTSRPAVKTSKAAEKTSRPAAKISPAVKASKSAAKPRSTRTVKSHIAARSHKKPTSRASHAAAKTHAASVTYRDRSAYSSTASASRPKIHSASIVKAIILFLGFVLLLAILANIFAPSIEHRHVNRNTMMNSGQNTNSSGYGQPLHPPNSNHDPLHRQYATPPMESAPQNTAP